MTQIRRNPGVISNSTINSNTNTSNSAPLSDLQLKQIIKAQREEEFLNFNKNPTSENLLTFCNARDAHWKDSEDPVNKLSPSSKKTELENDKKVKKNASEILKTQMTSNLVNIMFKK